MGRSFRGRRSRAGSPTQSAAERRRELADADDLADADTIVRGLRIRRAEGGAVMPADHADDVPIVLSPGGRFDPETEE